ncbi:HAD superfamily hydrolase (TIGR01509 family) [Rhodococcus sp. SMB37]|uniref:HAD family hydrolase n=1 Tax=Rhodococcus sp. SMB37 TaxID=2512213 RepID=UPI00105081BA|nr:HAD family phosphatase [Rhodococcus sp. SMB37]TCN50367.1 HAD superfamily hydrolase (TIGR01509 family) [Rhodococcus sp. SMB37]
MSELIGDAPAISKRAGVLQAVLWDMDGTLLESEQLWDIGMRELSLHLGGPMSEEVRISTIGGPLDLSVWRTFDGLGLDPTPDEQTAAEDWLNAYMSVLFAKGLPWRPGARDALGAVRAAGLGQALVTNTGRMLCDVALDTLGRDHFDHTVCGDEVPAGKPDPAPYLRAAELLGLDPAQCLAVEDSPTGAAAADAAGCTVLVVPSLTTVPASSRRVFRSTLEGLSVADLHALHASGRQ